MGTTVQLKAGQQMWLRKSAKHAHAGGWCWVLELVPTVPACVRILLDDGSGRPMADQLVDASPRGAVRIWTVARGQLVAGGTHTQIREARRQAERRQARLAVEQLLAARRAANVAPADPAG